MHDAISAEKQGIPAAAIITDHFAPTARAMASALGLPDYRFSIIAHPISNNSDEELRIKAEEALKQCLVALTERRE